MLTVKQPPTYGYKSVHDLPTPPSTSRPSPPLAYQETGQKSISAIPRSHSPSYQPMSAPHRGLPPPAAMALPPQQPPPAPVPPPSHHSQPPPTSSISQTHSQVQHPWSTLPAPPQQWQGAEEAMRNWLQARTEEEKTKQEEEKTRQESLRLEQRKIEMDILRASLGGGIPPPMVPLVFAGMGVGGVLPQAALEWAQQFMQSSQAHHPVHPAIQGAQANETQRDGPAQGHGQYTPAPAVQTSTPSSTSYGPYPGSPTRPRGQTLPGTATRPITGPNTLPSLGTTVSQAIQGTATAVPSQQQHAQVQPQPSQQESSPSIYFHHWQPPTSHGGGGSNRPGSPSGETPKKRKAPGSHQPDPAYYEQFRYRSPPSTHHASFGEPSPQQRSHKRQRSDVSWYQASGQRSTQGSEQYKAMSPGASQDRDRTGSRKPSVTSLLSGEPDDAVVSSQSNPQAK
ncbi:hypothetical protein HJFPF1_06543 [Paramyrothecium foliicola]|nr:hypothetical protein HJFPF1_06543 [Paramyrothecium foliicola]